MITEKRQYCLFMLTLLWGGINIWIPNHLPLTDLPEHAGQVVLFKDLILHTSAWADIFSINFATPYLTTYLLCAAISFLVSISTSIKIVLTASYLLFVFFCVRLRQYFKLDQRLDWMFVLPFFGFSYQYGFLSFVVSAPVALCFVLTADKYATDTTLKNGLYLATTGALLLMSHGLMFLFATGVGAMALLLKTNQASRLYSRSVPYIFLSCAFITMFLVNRSVNAQLGFDEFTHTSENKFNVISFALNMIRELPLRAMQAFFYNCAGSKININSLIHIPVIFILLAYPWLLGLKPKFNTRSTRTIMFVSLSALFFLVPGFIFGTYFVYQRFSILILPAYALLFSEKTINAATTVRFKITSLSVLAVILASWFLLAYNSSLLLSFRQESAEIDKIFSQLPEKKKALVMVYDPLSKAMYNELSYENYGAWYQAERHGLVYPNFAYWAPMLVRYKPNKVPQVFDGADVNTFDWIKHEGNRYDYFFVRNYDGINKAQKPVKEIFKSAFCLPLEIARSGQWIIYEKRNCLR